MVAILVNVKKKFDLNLFGSRIKGSFALAIFSTKTVVVFVTRRHPYLHWLPWAVSATPIELTLFVLRRLRRPS
jgi:hypothetical protein